MGLYVNHPTRDKIHWLKDKILEGKIAPVHMSKFLCDTFEEVDKQDKVYLILIDNGAFTGLRIVYDERDLQYMQCRVPEDQRPLLFFAADKQCVASVEKSYKLHLLDQEKKNET